MSARRFTSVILFMTAGLLIWAAQFAILYAFNALACARGFAAATMLGFGVVPLAVTAATLIAVSASAWVLWRGLAADDASADATGAFVNYTAIGVAVLGIVAVIWNWVPALIVPPCG